MIFIYIYSQPAKNRSKQYREEFDQSSNMFGLDDLVYDFKKRYESYIIWNNNISF